MHFRPADLDARLQAGRGDLSRSESSEIRVPIGQH